MGRDAKPAQCDDRHKPYINGKREITTVIMERTNNALRTHFFFNENNESKKMATVSVAVISGAKFA